MHTDQMAEISSSGETFEERVALLLQHGRREFDLPLGILASVIEDRYRVEVIRAPFTMQITPGTEFLLGETYCVDTLGSDEPVRFEKASATAWRGHPAYVQFGLESYIGAAVRVHGQTWGTINFSSPLPFVGEFGERDLALIRAMSAYVGEQLERERSAA